MRGFRVKPASNFLLVDAGAATGGVGEHSGGLEGSLRKRRLPDGRSRPRFGQHLNSDQSWA